MTAALCEHLSHTLLGESYERLAPVQQQVIDAIVREVPTGRSPELAPGGFWDELTDRVARVGGSWAFIVGFMLVLVLWAAINSPATKRLGITFDPYPFIFLNLVLSMIAAIQAPIILMSQNRAAAKDRLEAEHDYAINLRAELEILRLHDRFDLLEAQVAELLAHQRKTGGGLDAPRGEIEG